MSASDFDDDHVLTRRGDEHAIRFRPRIGDVAVPEIEQQDCNGCGACISACPEDALALEPRLPANSSEGVERNV